MNKIKKFQFVFETKNESLKGSFEKKYEFALYWYFVHVTDFTDTLSYRRIPCGSNPHRNSVSLLFWNVQKDVIF